MTRALIVSLPPRRGGVGGLTRTLLELLGERGVESGVAWYEPYRETPRLSVPSFRLGTRRPAAERREYPGALEGLAIGAWLPELEFTDYWPTRLWREVVDRADLHFVVSGNALPQLALSGRDHLAWVASDWEGDRRDRVRQFPLGRRALDRLIVRPITRRVERRVLRSGRVVALSEATRRELDAVAGTGTVRRIVPCPVDLEAWDPDPARVVRGRVGFLGRFDDPRKNLPLFLEALAAARSAENGVHAEVIGATGGAGEAALVARLGLEGAVTFAELSREEYVDRLSTFEVVVVTSFQEGLGIAALEAMAAGCPVVSTRCGGTEEFVEPGINGFLCGFDAREIASRILEILADPELRARLGREARSTVERRYSWRVVSDALGAEIDAYRQAVAARQGESTARTG